MEAYTDLRQAAGARGEGEGVSGGEREVGGGRWGRGRGRETAGGVMLGCWRRAGSFAELPKVEEATRGSWGRARRQMGVGPAEERAMRCVRSDLLCRAIRDRGTLAGWLGSRLRSRKQEWSRVERYHWITIVPHL